MFRRTFADNAPHITFTGTWQQLPFGNLVPGNTVQIAYDPARLPFERSNYNGAPTWSITAFYRFSPNGAISSKRLDTPTGQVVSRFSDDPVEATMMTTSIDIPGDALSCVIIDKIPFSTPDEPVHSALVDRLKRLGQDWFNGYALPEATIRLKQGFGRLIRTRSDRGVLSLLDNRITQQRYGQVFFDSLPDYAFSMRFADVEKFFDV